MRNRLTQESAAVRENWSVLVGPLWKKLDVIFGAKEGEHLPNER